LLGAKLRSSPCPRGGVRVTRVTGRAGGYRARRPMARKVFMSGDREGFRVPGLQRRSIRAVITAVVRAVRTGR
jgi:hypothetical protein